MPTNLETEKGVSRDEQLLSALGRGVWAAASNDMKVHVRDGFEPLRREALSSPPLLTCEFLTLPRTEAKSYFRPTPLLCNTYVLNQQWFEGASGIYHDQIILSVISGPLSQRIH